MYLFTINYLLFSNINNFKIKQHVYLGANEYMFVYGSVVPKVLHSAVCLKISSLFIPVVVDTTL